METTPTTQNNIGGSSVYHRNVNGMPHCENLGLDESGKNRIRCNYCRKVYIGGGINGTRTMIDHLRKKHSNYYDVGLATPVLNNPTQSPAVDSSYGKLFFQYKALVMIFSICRSWCKKFYWWSWK